MNKRYQVFVSSTYSDLKEERQKVFQTLMEMDCIPSGMELFPAVDEDQWQFIKKVIDDCDYYLLIIGGRYGTITAEGISYTEKEFDYAVGLGLRVIALVHGAPDDIPFGKSEQDPALRARLDAFREKAMSGRLVKFWKTPDELAGVVSLSMNKTMKAYPAVGWVRADRGPSPEVLAELNELRRKVSDLTETLADAQRKAAAEPLLDNLAPLTTKFRLSGTEQSKVPYVDWCIEVTLLDAFCTTAPFLFARPVESAVKARLATLMSARQLPNVEEAAVNDYEFDTLKMNFVAHGLVTLQPDKGGLHWILTPAGASLVVRNRAVMSNGQIDEVASE